jgi:hypothetical protein
VEQQRREEHTGVVAHLDGHCIGEASRVDVDVPADRGHGRDLRKPVQS